MDLPNNADIVLSPAHNLQVGLRTIYNYLCCIHGRLVHVDETSTDLQILSCELHKKMRLAAELRPDLLGEL